jgi:hypothetical protein
VPEMNQQVAEQTAALADNWKQVAQDTFGNGLLRVGQDGKMTIDLRWGGGGPGWARGSGSCGQGLMWRGGLCMSWVHSCGCDQRKLMRLGLSALPSPCPYLPAACSLPSFQPQSRSKPQHADLACSLLCCRSPFMGALAPGATPGQASGLDLDLSKVLAQPQVVALGEAVSANYQAAIDAFAGNVVSGGRQAMVQGQGGPCWTDNGAGEQEEWSRSWAVTYVHFVLGWEGRGAAQYACSTPIL